MPPSANESHSTDGSNASLLMGSPSWNAQSRRMSWLAVATPLALQPAAPGSAPTCPTVSRDMPPHTSSTASLPLNCQATTSSQPPITTASSDEWQIVKTSSAATLPDS